MSGLFSCITTVIRSYLSHHIAFFQIFKYVTCYFFVPKVFFVKKYPQSKISPKKFTGADCTGELSFFDYYLIFTVEAWPFFFNSF